MLKKISLIILLILTLFITSCTEVVTTCTVTVNDGTNTTEYTINKGDNLTFLESPTKFKHQFAGWYNGDKLINVNNPVEEDLSIEAKFEYVYNQTGFDGNGMEYKIISFYNTESENVNFDSMNSYVKQINKIYHINIVYDWYSNYDDYFSCYYSKLYEKNLKYDAVYGLDITSLLNCYIGNTFPGKVNEILVLDDGTENSIFKQYGYTQSEFANSQVTIDGNVYGFNPNVEYINYGLMTINKNVIKEYNLDDPYEMYLKGEWTFSNFQKWIEDAYNVMIDSEYSFYCLSPRIYDNILYMYQNFAAALGYPLAEDPTQTSLSVEIEDHYNLTEYLNDLYEKSNIYYNARSNDSDDNFLILNYRSDFTEESRNDYYFIPYPMADDQKGELILSNDSNDALYNAYGNAITDDYGNYITAIDLTNTTFKINVRNYNNAYYFKKTVDNQYGLTDDISFEIIYDLIYLKNKDYVTNDLCYNNIDLSYYHSKDYINKVNNYCDNIILYCNCYNDQTFSIAYRKFGGADLTLNLACKNYLKINKFTKDNVKRILNFDFHIWRDINY